MENTELPLREPSFQPSCWLTERVVSKMCSWFSVWQQGGGSWVAAFQSVRDLLAESLILVHLPHHYFFLHAKGKRSFPILHLGNWGPGYHSWFLSALLSSPRCVQALSQAVEWTRNQRNFFSFLQLWHDSEECPRDKCFLAATSPREVRSWFRLALSSRI